MPTFSLEEITEETAFKLFEDEKLDEISWGIIAQISQNGIMNKYQLTHSIKGAQTNKIHRRIIGSPFYLGLKDNDFLHEKKYVLPENRPREIHYGLSFKGFLASLSQTQIIANYLFKVVKPIISKEIKQEEVTDAIMRYIKLEIAAWLLSFAENGLKLTNVKDTMRLYHRTKNVERIFGSRFDSVHPDYSVQRGAADANSKFTDYERGYSETWLAILEVKRIAQEKINNLLVESRDGDLRTQASYYMDRWYVIMMEGIPRSAGQDPDWLR